MTSPRSLRFVDLFAGLGGFHSAGRSLGHECVFACEIDPVLRKLYSENHKSDSQRIWGDVREVVTDVPPHHLLFAGFPCQPFSKSGRQRGLLDQTRGTLFHEILAICEVRRPDLVILENVGNFVRHDRGRTWEVVRSSLEQIGYSVRGTEPRIAGGHGLVSPHHHGFPHHRERFFAVAAMWDLPDDPFPDRSLSHTVELTDLVTSRSSLTDEEIAETALTNLQVRCIDHWNRFIRQIPPTVALPSFPIWGDELGATYPYEETTPAQLSTRQLRSAVAPRAAYAGTLARDELLALLPTYARRKDSEFPAWKKRFITQNREWFNSLNGVLDDEWIHALRSFPPSLRKFEWNCQGEERYLWRCVLQFRPSGLRAKRYSSVPALVAMTTTQIPILGPERRFITRREALRLQGFDDTFALPESRAAAFSGLGNAVHVKVAQAVIRNVIQSAPAGYSWGAHNE